MKPGIVIRLPEVARPGACLLPRPVLVNVPNHDTQAVRDLGLEVLGLEIVLDFQGVQSSDQLRLGLDPLPLAHQLSCL